MTMKHNVRYGFVLFFENSYPPTDLYHPEVFLSQTQLPCVYSCICYSKEQAEEISEVCKENIVFSCKLRDEEYEIIRIETTVVVERTDTIQKK